ncbi:intradiol ring-cleavage dioxygenase [Streptomyces sp. NPDC093223]|uniref:intradiol ring-cleavage dioxygenase n=1 Tax=Streptomyces sp. NPDC093223 TaxID=3366033 RepID=UPI003829FCC0
MTTDNTSLHPHGEPARTMQRRTVLAALGIGATSLGLGSTALPKASASPRPPGSSVRRPSCILAPEAIEGPYFIDEDLIRRNITEDREGVPLEMRITVVDGVKCVPIAGAKVDIWHCDAEGWYSGHLDTSPDVPPTGPDHVEPTDPSRFLRGVQTTDRRGEVRFRSIYPGWYYGRAIHVHLTVHVDGLEVHTGQLYFPEKFNKKVALLEPYARHTGTERLPNQEDDIYVQEGGAQTTMDVRPLRPGRLEHGCIASITAGVIPGHTPPAPTLPASA